MTDDDAWDIPEFLRITPERDIARKAAWERNPPRPLAPLASPRASNLTAADLEARKEILADLAHQEALRAATREPQKQAYFEAKRQAQEEAKAIKAAVAATKQELKKLSPKRNTGKSSTQLGRKVVDKAQRSR